MNEKAFEDAYNLFSDNGYSGSPDDFKKLISENPNALNDAHRLFQQNGYSGNIDNFKTLVGVEAPKQEEPGMIQNMVSGVKDMFGFGDDVKKKEQQGSTASPSAKSSLVSPSKPKTAFEIAAARARGEFIPPTGTLEEQAKAVGETDSYMGMTVPKSKTYAGKQEAEKKQEAQIQDRFTKAITSKEDFNTSLKDVNPNLITKDEEIVVPQLQNLFGDYGFKFEEVGFGYDAIEVTAPNGKKKTISIDKFTDAGDIESSNELKSFIDANKPKIENEVSQYDKYYKRYRSQKEVDDATKSINQDLSTILSDKDKLAADIAKTKILEQQIRNNPTQESIDLLTQQKESIAQRSASLAERQTANTANRAKLDEAVGRYTRNAENEGTWYGITANTLTEGIYGIGAGLMDVSAYVQSKAKALTNATELAIRGDIPLSDAWKVANILSNAEKEEITKGIEKGKDILKENVEFDVSEAYKKKAQENFLARNALGVVGFLPAIGASMINPTAGYTAFFASGYDGAMEEMKNNPAFENVSTDEKAGVATALGFANAAIMAYSPTNKFLETAPGKAMVARILKMMGSEASAKTVQEFAANEVKSAVNRGLITTGGNLAHGFATGVELKLSGDAVKAIYNEAKSNTSYSINGQSMSEGDFKNAVSKMSSDELKEAVVKAENPSGEVESLLQKKAKDANIEGTSFINKTQMFQFPDNTADYLKEVAESGLDMAVGSAMMGGIKSLSTGYKNNNFNGVSDDVINNYKALASPEYMDAYETSLNIKVANGDMTSRERDAEMNDARMGIAVLNKMPDTFNAAQKRKAFSLIREREILNASIEGKDESLVKPQKERIKAINSELEELSTAKPEEAKPAEAAPAPAVNEAGGVGEALTDEARIERRKKNKDVLEAKGSTFFNDVNLSNAKIGDEIHYTDNEGVSNKTKVKDIVDGEVIFENGQTQKDVSSYMNITAEDAWFAKNKPAETAPAEPTAKPKTLDEIQDEELKSNLSLTLSAIEDRIKGRKERRDDAVENQPSVLKPFAKLTRAILERLPTSENKRDASLKQKAEQIKNNPEQFLNDEISELEKYKEEQGEDFKDDGYLNYLKEQQAKLQEENAIQKPTTEEGVLRTEQPEVELPTMGKGNAQETTAEEGVAPAKPEEVNGLNKNEKQYALQEGISEENAVPTRNIFKKILEGKIKGIKTTIEQVKELIKSNQYTEKEVNIDDIAPSQLVVEKDKISKVENKDNLPIIGQLGNEFVVLDGHHRIAADILNGEKTVKAKVIDLSKETPAKPEEVKAEKPIEQEVSELEQMFPEEGPTGENKGVAITDTKGIEEIKSRAKEDRVTKTIETAQKVLKTLKSILPNFDIHLHETEESYNGAMEEINGAKDSSGHFYFKRNADGGYDGRIDINLSNATARDIYHEVSHAILLKAFGENQKLFESFQDRISKVLSTDKNQALLDFANNPKYKEQGVTYEEYMAELKAVLAEQGEKLELSTAKKIAAVINEFVSKLTGGKVKPFQELTDTKQLFDFVNKATSAMAKGEELNVEGAKEMGKEPISRASHKVYHGTPHEFEKFTTEKIGTGEGAQAFGWGLYFTDLKDIAELYAKKLTKETWSYNSKEISKPTLEYLFLADDPLLDIDWSKERIKELAPIAIDRIKKEWIPDYKRIKKDYPKQASEMDSDIKRAKESLKELNEIIKSNDISKKEKKSVYDVTLHEGKTPDQYTYLEWDKPLSESIRKKINAQFEKEGIETHPFLKDGEPQVGSGRATYDLISSKLKSPKEASLFLLRAGIDGVKYPAEFMSGATSETARGFNYVIFDENAAKVNSVSRSSLRNEINKVEDVVKQARANGYSERAIEEFLRKRGVADDIIEKSLGNKEAKTKITTNEEVMPGYDKMMDEVNSKILDGLNRKAKQETILANVMKVVEGSEAYKNATDQQREQIMRDVKEAFGEQMKSGPSAEKITGKEQKEKQVVISDTQALKDQIKLEMKAANEGASSVREAVKKIRDFVIKNKDVANLTRRDLLKVIDIIKTVKDEKSLEKASEKITSIIDKANKDIIEVSKTKLEADKAKAELKAAKEKMKAELKAAKESAKGVVDKVKAIKKYFDSVKEYGNLTRKDLTRVMAEIAKVKDEKTLDNAVNKINDIIDNAKTDKIEISEKKMTDNIEKSIRAAKRDVKKASKNVANEVKELVRKGKITTKQMTAVLRKFAKTNVLSDSSVKEFTDYMTKVFTNAEYANKLSDARKLRKIISKASKSKTRDANLVKLASEFKKIDPSMVDDIDLYNKMASSIREAMKGSSLTKEGVQFADSVKIADVNEYAQKEIELQKEKYMESLRNQVQDLLGVDASTMSYNEMLKLLSENTKEKFTEEQKEAILKATKDMFEAHSDTIKKMLETGKDPSTGEDIEISESNKTLVKQFMGMDISKMKILDAIAAVDALNNFIVNQSTAKMADVVYKYEGRENSLLVKAKNIVAKPLRLYFNKKTGRVITEQFATLPMVFDRLFKSAAVGAYVQKMMGVTDLLNNKAKASAISKKATNEYVDKFYKREANGEKFNSSYNDVERGVFADFLRTIIGSPEQIKEEFERKKGLLEQSIKKLKKGTKTQKKKAEIYQKVYDKIIKDSESIEDVKGKVDPANIEAVDYWIKEWGVHYDKLADVSENVYNKILDKESNYTPVRMSKIKEDNSLDTEESAFHGNNGTVFKKKTGSLMEATRPDELPENRYVDYSFDSKMVNSLHDALVDIYTAADVRKVEAFMKSDSFEDIIPETEDREMLEGRIQLLVRNFRNKNHYDYDELEGAMKYVNKLGQVGVSASLGALAQPFKQTIPVAVNTLINAGNLKFSYLKVFGRGRNEAINKFIDESGYAIATRGKESISDIRAVDTMIEDIATNAASKGAQWTTKKLEKLQEFYLKKLLVNPDIGVARMSWITYYERYLKKQGKDISDIDYSDHKLDKDAADYAQKMVDRQQNISDADLKGKFFSRKDALSQLISKTIFPFASFRINQSTRLASDFITLTSKTATTEDRAIAARSLAGASTEIAVFNAIGFGITSLLYGTVKSMMANDDEDEESRKKREEADEKYLDNLLKGRVTSAAQDFLSPLPITDYALQYGIYHTMDALNGEEKKGKKDEQFNILKPKDKDLYQSLGTLGIIPSRAGDLLSIIGMAKNGTYTDDYGNTKNIRRKDQDVVKALIPLAIINSVGALPTEAYTTQNIILKDIKKQSSTKTEAEIIQDKARKREERADNITKIKIINQAINEADDQEVVNELMKMKRETRNKIFKPEMSDEAKEILKRKSERERAKYQHLLGGYDTKDDLKRYDPELYEQNFGEGSDYYATHEAEVKADKLYDKIKKQYKDELYDYQAPPKKKTKHRKKNKDGSYKSSYFKFSSK